MNPVAIRRIANALAADGVITAPCVAAVSAARLSEICTRGPHRPFLNRHRALQISRLNTSVTIQGAHPHVVTLLHRLPSQTVVLQVTNSDKLTFGGTR